MINETCEFDEKECVEDAEFYGGYDWLLIEEENQIYWFSVCGRKDCGLCDGTTPGKRIIGRIERVK
jgi:hypothetical protein